MQQWPRQTCDGMQNCVLGRWNHFLFSIVVVMFNIRDAVMRHRLNQFVSVRDNKNCDNEKVVAREQQFKRPAAHSQLARTRQSHCLALSITIIQRSFTFPLCYNCIDVVVIVVHWPRK
jgi:hypothetical protein